KSSLRQLPWGLMLVILCSGVVLGMLFMGAQQGDDGFGSGLKALLSASEQDETDLEIAALIDSKSIEPKSTEKEFDFYEILPDIEQVMPGDLPEAIPTRPPENVNYYLQAASFREHADAENLRARLALKGYSSVTQAREVEGKGTYYRVRLGPYADSRKAKTAKNKLQRLGVRPFVYSVKND
ncbi:MAG: SPOR domain-containing protein, partial [Acidiferrobacterales bacterium]|nr:SPOR domain-containing protein [Acidiferrobacterales bacterium]